MARRAATSGEKGQRAVVGRRTYGEIARATGVVAAVADVAHHAQAAVELLRAFSRPIWPVTWKPGQRGEHGGDAVPAAMTREQGSKAAEAASSPCDDAGAGEQGGGGSVLSAAPPADMW
uniref:Uncharacterized protein n=1 Tax=Oryza nivara TaxID=4536 RepID=A0A0E0HR02_ORYNI